MAGGNFGGGDGTQGNPYLVEDLADLSAIRNNMSAHYLQVKDIKGGTIESIGAQGNFLSGSYDGGLHTLENITIRYTPSVRNFVALFAGTRGGSIKRVIMKNCIADYVVNVSCIVGLMEGGFVSQCCVIDSTAKSEFKAGGYIVGEVAEGPNEIRECFAIDTVPNSNSAAYGIVGEMYSQMNSIVSDCYYRNTNGAAVISGILENAGSYDYISNCYTAFRGGVNAIGEFAENPPSNCYYDAEFSGLSSGYGVGKTTAEMKQQETFVNWNFGSIWGIDENINDGYPHLLWYPYKDDGEIDGTLNLHAKKNEIWHKAKDLYAKKNGVWSKAKDLYGNKQGWNKSQ